MYRLKALMVCAAAAASELEIQIETKAPLGRYLPDDPHATPSPAPVERELAAVAALYAGLRFGTKSGDGGAYVVAGWAAARLYGAVASARPGAGLPAFLAEQLFPLMIRFTSGHAFHWLGDEADPRLAPHLKRSRDGIDDFKRLEYPREEVARVERLEFAARDGSAAVPVHFFVPFPSGSRNATVPLVLWYHAGGLVVGSAVGFEHFARHAANEVGAVIALVDYRLAPEHKYPAAHDDALDSLVFATAWCAADPRCDQDRVAVAGDSAGGMLAAATALATARPAGSASPAVNVDLSAQLLLCPWLAPFSPFHSKVRSAADPVLPSPLLDWFAAQAFADPLREACDPRASVLVDDDVDWARVPPAVVETGHFDPLADEGDAYARRLHAKGVSVTAARRLSMHCGKEMYAWALAALRAALNGDEAPACC